MNWPPAPKSWFTYPVECLWYLFPGIVFHVVALVLSVIVVVTFRAFKCRTPHVATILIFQGYLLLAAMHVNGFWSCAVWGRFYWSVDYTADFSVFYPITHRQIENTWGPQMSGGLNGITLGELNVMWAIHATVAWLLAFFATRWTIHLNKRD
jgi:hypothetical protein